MTQSPTGGPAQTTYQVTSRAGVVGHDAQRVVIVTDGRPAEGGPQQAVYFVSDAEIAAGDFIVTGNKPLPIVQVGAAGVEYPPIAVYDVTGKPDDAQPSQGPAIAPQFSSAEVGTVNASTVAVIFDQGVNATGNDYSSGVTIKVNGSTRSFESGIRQADHTLVYYALATPVEAGDTVTWEYSAASGSIVSESDGTALANVTAQTVTNNVTLPLPQVASAMLLLDLRASQLALSDGDPVSTWPDVSGDGRDFTQTGTARPTYRAGGGVPYLEFDGAEDWMLGPNFADNLSSFTVFVSANVDNGSDTTEIIYKIPSGIGTPGWLCFFADTGFIVQTNSSNKLHPAWQQAEGGTKAVYTYERSGQSSADFFYNGSNSLTSYFPVGTVTSIANAEPVRIGYFSVVFTRMNLYAVLIYAPAPNATDRAAIETWLATNP